MQKDIDDMLQNTHYHFQAFCTRKTVFYDIQQSRTISLSFRVTKTVENGLKRFNISGKIA